MKIEIKKDGWWMTFTGPRDCRKAILKGRDTANIRAQVPAEWWAEAEAMLAKARAQDKAEAAAFAAIGFIQQGSQWVLPEGHIAVTSDGPAEEYLPGFFRQPHHLRLEDDGRVTADMEDAEGYGPRMTLVGVTPRPERPTKSKNWRDSLTAEEITEKAMADEEQE